VRVVRTVPNTPASRSGILPGDTVMRIDAREVYRPADVMDASFFSHVGGQMTVVVRRNESLYNYTFAVIERPAPPAAPPATATKTTAIIPVNDTVVAGAQ
jgi:S1-C subfamily serine protease